jgi:hypothetical protein
MKLPVLHSQTHTIELRSWLVASILVPDFGAPSTTFVIGPKKTSADATLAVTIDFDIATPGRVAPMRSAMPIHSDANAFLTATLRQRGNSFVTNKLFGAVISL